MEIMVCGLSDFPPCSMYTKQINKPVVVDRVM